jgi:hypothetical protein
MGVRNIIRGDAKRAITDRQVPVILGNILDEAVMDRACRAPTVKAEQNSKRQSWTKQSLRSKFGVGSYGSRREACRALADELIDLAIETPAALTAKNLIAYFENAGSPLTKRQRQAARDFMSRSVAAPLNQRTLG